MRPLILASASTTRAKILAEAGVVFVSRASSVDEDSDQSATSEMVAELAARKARALVETYADALVLGCDSLLEVDGVAYGKPSSAADAAARWRMIRGRSGTLMTGHVLIDAASRREGREVVATLVHFGSPSEAEIDAYVRSGEPLDKAGAFTLEGRSSAFIRGIEGDAGNVRGLSLPALARLLRGFDCSITDFWA